jgi:CMD domain protein
MNHRASTAAGTDVIDAVLGIAPGSPLAALREQRSEVKRRTQSSYAALFGPLLLDGLTQTDRYAVALRVADLNASAALVAHYTACLEAEEDDVAVPDAVEGVGPAAALSPRQEAMLRHAELLTQEPKAATPADLRKLAAHGLSEPEIVTLAQVVAFVNYQVRVVAGLALLGEIA